MNKLLVFLGPTSTGKTDLALGLAKKFNGELVACDSRQVYWGLDIGTGKLPSELKIENLKLKIEKGNGWWKVDGVKIWMYDVADPKRQYSVFDYVRDANKVIDEILARGKRPIIVGGTGFYLKALLEGLPNLETPQDLKLRKELAELSLSELQKRLQEISLARWERMNASDRQNSRRLVRAIEIIQNSNVKTQMSKLQLKSQNYNILKVGLTAPREVLYQRIDERVIDRINQGMIEEARVLHKNNLSFKRMRQLGLEYGVLADFLQSRIKTEDELVRILQGKIHGFARRQLTWFGKACLPAGRKQKMFWCDITEKNYEEKVENLVSKWYDNPSANYAS